MDNKNKILGKLKGNKPIYSVLLYRLNIIIGLFSVIFYNKYIYKYSNNYIYIKYFYILYVLLVVSFFVSYNKKIMCYIDEIIYIVSFISSIALIYINIVLKFNNIFLCLLIAGFFIMIECINKKRLLYLYYFSIMPLSISAGYLSNASSWVLIVLIMVFFFIGLIAFFSVYERIKTVKYYEEKVYIDGLTGLLNRLAVNKLLIQMSQKTKLGFSIVYIDIDNFNEINNTFGQKVGDIALKKLSINIEKCIMDDCILGRFGGDEFILIFPKVYDAEKAKNIYNNIVKKLEVRLPQLNYKYSVSAGISVYSDDMHEVQDLILYAKKASHRAKKIHGNSVLVYEYSYKMEDEYNKKIIEAIRFKGEESIINFYQPIMSKNGEITKFEALSRMQIEPNKIIPPVVFIPLAEATGLIEIVDYRAAEQAFKFISRCKDELNFAPSISINASAITFNYQYAQKLIQLKDKYNIEPGYITVEIIESVLIKNYKYANQIIDQLKNQGFLIAIDDFGSGFSSLAYVKNMKFDIFKLDKSLIDGLTESNIDIVEHIVKLGKLLNMKVVIEGIEDKRQMELLSNSQCDYFQGYLISKPVTEEKTFEIIREHIKKIK